MSGGFQNKGPAGGSQLTAAEELWVQTGEAGVLLLTETTAPSATSGVGKVYVKSSDSLLYFKDDAGNEYSLTAGASGANTALSNLASVAINAALVLGTSDAFALGSTSKMWSDLFLADGSVINFNNGDITITHSTNSITVSGGVTGTASLAIVTSSSENAELWITHTTGATGKLKAQDAQIRFTSTSPILFDSDDGGTLQLSLSTAGAKIGTLLAPNSNDGAALGTSSLMWSDLFLASGAVINFNNGDVVATHSTGILTVGTGDLRVTTAGTNSASVVTIGGTQTLTAKTLTAPKIASGGFIADANGNELIIFTTTASAVNEWTLANGSTGVNPKLTASGETNVGLDFQGKGTGTYRFLGTASQAAELRLYEDTDDGTNYTAFKVGTQGADITYTLPTAVAGGNGYALTSTTGGVLSWSSVGAGDMVLASAQTNTGAKTFNANTILDKGSMVYNVKAYGAVGDDSTDDTTAIQNAVAAAGATGGIVWFPSGTYKITTSIKLYNATPNPDVPYSNIKIFGAGSSGTLGSIVKQYTTGEDVFKGLNDVTNNVQLLNVSFQDICLTFGGTATNSGNGIYLKQVAAGGPSFQGMYFENVVVSNCNGSGKYGFNFESMITSSVVNCMAVSCNNGFYLNGSVGGSFNSVSTSVTFLNCYANGCTSIGYNCLQNTYISFVGCAADFASGSGQGYLVDTSNCVTFTGCGAELSGTFSGQLWKLTGAANVVMTGCYAFQNDNVAVLVTGTSLKVTINGFQNNSDTSTATTGLQVDAGSEVTDIDCDWGTAPNPDTPISINATGIYRTPGRVRVTSETSSATPTINIGRSDMHSITALAAAVTSMTTNLTGTATDGQKLVVRFKDNGTARAITWGASFEAKGVALPTTTVISKVLTVGFIYDSATSKWGCVASAQEA